MSRNFTESSTGSQASCASTRPLFKTFGHHDNNKNGGMSTFPRNIEQVPSNRHFQHQNRPMSTTSSRGLPSSDSSHPHVNRQFMEVPYLSSHHNIDNRLQPRSNRINPHLNFDDTLSESCATTNRDDDDATTTSGSYTVNADELCDDIDDMFFKPDTVV